jgi:hypothetical protein
MKFKHADYRSIKSLYTGFSFARTGCILGCAVIALLGNINTIRYGMASCDSNDYVETAHTSDAGPINFTYSNSLLPTEAFLSTEQKDDPFQMLLVLRERYDSCVQAWMRPCRARSQARARVYLKPARASLSRFLYSGQLLC